MQDRKPTPQRKDEARKDVASTRQQQHTGNHPKHEREPYGADDFGGTRAGAENVEPKDGKEKHESG